MNERFTEKASHAISRSAKIAGSLGHTYVGSEHLLQALLETEDSSADSIFKKHCITREDFKKAICEYSGTGMISSVGPDDMTPRCRRILERSHICASKHGTHLIGTEHILYALVEEKDSIAIRLLKNLGVNVSFLKDDVQGAIKSRSQEKVSKSADTPNLKLYGRNFTELAKQDKFDPVIGRERETDRLIRVLCRKNKNNPCLIGEAGVGKSAIVEGLALRIASGSVPDALKEALIISVDLTSMVAGAKYRGDFEERIKNIVSEASKNRSIILFIDEIHTIVGAGAAEGAIDASNILKPQLSRGELRIIGATTFSEYRKYIEKDPALERRFQPIDVQEPSEYDAVSMLMGIKARYEQHHGVRISREVVQTCVNLSVKYVNDRFLPDKAIDVMDEACAYTASRKNNSKSHNTDVILRQNFDAMEDAICRGDFDMAHEISSALPRNGGIPRREGIDNADDHICVSIDDVKYVISEITSIDISDIRSGPDYDVLEDALNENIAGQESAVKRVVSAIKRSECGLIDSNRPRAIMLFVGGSGVGKTLLASTLAHAMFRNKSSFLRYDMSEYSEKHSVSKLIGAPPGYSGYDNGGTLTEQVRKSPHSLILLDEIEKADPEVQNLFLQIADNGFLCDSAGRRISFRSTIIIMTSNAGSSINRSGPLGFATSQNDESLINKLRHHFSFEFLNRFDEIISFAPLSKPALAKIATNRLNELSKALKKANVELIIEDDVIDCAVERSYDSAMGARSILRYIAAHIECEISDALLRHPETKAIHICAHDTGVEISTADNSRTNADLSAETV